MSINGTTQLTGIFGYPVTHTLSPFMQNAAFTFRGLNIVYLPFEVSPEALGDAVSSLRTLRMLGVNVTIPHKENVLRFLDKIDPLAQRIGSVNTIVNRDGCLTGYNTDGSGFIKDLKGHGFNPKNKTVLIVGAGGAGRALAATLSWAGAKTIYICDSDEGRAQNVARKTPRARVLPIDSWKESINKADLLVNTTPCGMHTGDPVIAEATELRHNLFVYDIIYNRKTELVTSAQKAGAKACNGLGMLLFQGALAFELWTGKKAPVNVMRTALLKALTTGRR